MTKQGNGAVFSPQESSILLSALVEVIYGFELADFEITIGADAAKVEQLLKRMSSADKTGNQFLTPADVSIARNSLRETIRELGDEEFGTRTGYDLDEAKNVLNNIHRLFGESVP